VSYPTQQLYMLRNEGHSVRPASFPHETSW